MQNQPSNKKTVILAVVLIIVLVAAYFVFFKGNDPTATSDLVQQPFATGPDGVAVPGGTYLPGQAGVAPLGADLLPYLAQLQALKLDRSLFDDPLFSENILVDHTVTILEQPHGRTNPFAPLNKEVKSATTTTAKTTKTTKATVPKR